jgi:integrase
MTTRHRNNGLRKTCDCPRRKWAKCQHSWKFNFKPKGGPAYRFAVDTEAGKHIEFKTDAEALADGWRKAIREGTFRKVVETPAAVASDALTLAALIDRYFERRGKPATSGEQSYAKQFRTFVPAGADRSLGDTAVTAITEDLIEVFFTHLRTKGRAASTRNQYIQLVKALFRWATKKGYFTRNPIADSENIKREKHAKRNRRLMSDVINDKGKIEREGEERRLLAVSGSYLQRVIIVALETGCRRGELLSLEWRDVNRDRNEITVRSETTKTKTTRILPISTRLAGVLDMARTALETTMDSGPTRNITAQERAALLGRCFVFGDETGLKVANCKRAWETAVLKAHGHTPERTKHRGKGLAKGSRRTLDAIDLHFHDLRHEAGSRLLETGWPLHHVQQMLGHANISQTSTYLNANRMGLQDSMRRFEVVAPGCTPVARKPQTDHSLECNSDAPEAGELSVN